MIARKYTETSPKTDVRLHHISFRRSKAKTMQATHANRQFYIQLIIYLYSYAHDLKCNCYAKIL